MPSPNDYSHILLDIRRKLHDQRGSKAAVLIGAGFSRNAISRSGDGKKFPLWDELTRRMAERLYPDEDDRKRLLERAGATSVALRLAQEFEIAFGRSTLIEFVRDSIRDDEFITGDLHQQLLDLPWADVFTTNYDRLLEVTARTRWKRHYEPVLSVSDLPIARRPRIVKLHGTMPGLDPMVLTEEDFRKYPIDFAPFVTTVQGSLTENILCLIGFSGDDPNFLAWTGWLRDSMGTAIPKTYLFTGKDDLKPFQRQLLEQRQIIPIPLMSLAGQDSDYDAAFRWLFNKLSKPPGEPQPSWNIGPRYVSWERDADIAEEPQSPPQKVSLDKWIDTAILWRRHRLQYRGWCVQYEQGANRLSVLTEEWMKAALKLKDDSLSAPTKLFVLRELAWRWSTALQPFYDYIVFELFDPALTDFDTWRKGDVGATFDIKGEKSTVTVTIGEFEEAYTYLLLACLRHAREIARDDRFNELRVRIEETESLKGASWRETQAAMTHERILLALCRLRHSEARDLITSWDTQGSDVIWTIRRAGLSLECGLFGLGRRLLDEALASQRSAPVAEQFDVRRMSAEGLILSLIRVADSTLPAGGRGDVMRLQKSDRSQPSSDEFDSLINEIEPLSVASNRGDRFCRPRNSSETNSYDESGRNEVDRLDMKAIVDRLIDLRKHGCDPGELMLALEAVLDKQPRRQRGTFTIEEFEIGLTTSSTRFGTEPQLKAAYRALRFIEDAGMPLRVPSPDGRSSVTVASNLYEAASATVAFFIKHEGCGFILRTREPKRVETVVGRQLLAQLAEESVESMLRASRVGLELALRELGSSRLETDNSFWVEQLDTATMVLGRFGLRATDERVGELASELLPIPARPELSSQRRGLRELATTSNLIASGLRKPALEKLIPMILQTPVPGELPLDPNNRWFDMAVTLSDFRWPPKDQAVRDSESPIRNVIQKLRLAEGCSRKNLSVRLAHLCDTGLMVDILKHEFRDALFLRRDSFGFPTDTNCFDSLILDLPQAPDFDELSAFRDKHLRPADVKKTDWRCLSHTRRPLSRGRVREIAWTNKDIDLLLDLATKWFQSEVHHSEPMPDLVRKFAFGDSLETKVSVWLACLENCVLLSSRRTAKQRLRANELITQAASADMCVVELHPIRVKLEFVSQKDAITTVIDSLASHAWETVRQGCRAIVKWAQLELYQRFHMPTVLIDHLVSLIQSRRHEHLSPLLHTLAGVIAVSKHDRQVELFARVERSVSELLIETRYANDDSWQQHFGHSIHWKLKVRTQCATLLNVFRHVGIKSDTLAKWELEIANDPFADVRRTLDLPPIDADE